MFSQVNLPFAHRECQLDNDGWEWAVFSVSVKPVPENGNHDGNI